VTDVFATAIEVRWGGYDPEVDAHYDGSRVLRPGEELVGLSFEELARRGVGSVAIGDGA
jgi:hypothetical protein